MSDIDDDFGITLKNSHGKTKKPTATANKPNEFNINDVLAVLTNIKIDQKNLPKLLGLHEDDDTKHASLSRQSSKAVPKDAASVPEFPPNEIAANTSSVILQQNAATEATKSGHDKTKKAEKVYISPSSFRIDGDDDKNGAISLKLLADFSCSNYYTQPLTARLYARDLVLPGDDDNDDDGDGDAEWTYESLFSNLRQDYNTAANTASASVSSSGNLLKSTNLSTTTTTDTSTSKTTTDYEKKSAREQLWKSLTIIPDSERLPDDDKNRVLYELLRHNARDAGDYGILGIIDEERAKNQQQTNRVDNLGQAATTLTKKLSQPNTTQSSHRRYNADYYYDFLNEFLNNNNDCIESESKKWSMVREKVLKTLLQKHDNLHRDDSQQQEALDDTVLNEFVCTQQEQDFLTQIADMMRKTGSDFKPATTKNRRILTKRSSNVQKSTDDEAKNNNSDIISIMDSAVNALERISGKPSTTRNQRQAKNAAVGNQFSFTDTEDEEEDDEFEVDKPKNGRKGQKSSVGTGVNREVNTVSRAASELDMNGTDDDDFLTNAKGRIS